MLMLMWAIKLQGGVKKTLRLHNVVGDQTHQQSKWDKFTQSKVILKHKYTDKDEVGKRVIQTKRQNTDSGRKYLQSIYLIKD